MVVVGIVVAALIVVVVVLAVVVVVVVVVVGNVDELFGVVFAATLEGLFFTLPRHSSQLTNAGEGGIIIIIIAVVIIIIVIIVVKGAQVSSVGVQRNIMLWLLVVVAMVMVVKETNVITEEVLVGRLEGQMLKVFVTRAQQS